MQSIPDQAACLTKRLFATTLSGAVEFPGLLGVGLHRLRLWMQRAPWAAVGPLFGIIGADIALDLSRGNLTGAGVELVIAPLLALTITFVAQRSHPGVSGLLLLGLGAISALGASSLLALAIAHGSGPLAVMGARHLTVAIYAWAAIATEPPPRRRLVVKPVQV